jgi:Contact-dependent growth inhibition CdiA C-terminal domain
MDIDGPYSNPDAGDGYPDGHPRRGHIDRPGGQSTTRDPPETRSRQEYREELVSACSSELGYVRPWTAVQSASEPSGRRTALDEGAVDRVGLGVVDERAKKFSPAERRIADYLAAGGLTVISVSEGFGIHGRTPDACANGVPVEFKTLDPGASDRTVKAALNSAKGQARNAVIDARGSGLTEDQADTGIRRFAGTPHGDRLDAVLIIGDDYIIDWKRDN